MSKLRIMLREEVYQKVAEEFGTSIGVANIIGFKKKKEHQLEYTPESYKELSNELDIHNVICNAIDNEWYQPLQRKIYEVKKTASPRIKETTIYKRAWKELIDGNDKRQTNSTKRGEIYSDL